MITKCCLLLGLLLAKIPVQGQGGPACSSFTNRTTTNGLGDNYVFGVYATGNIVYAATSGGLSISTDGGNTFTNRTTANGLGGNRVRTVYAVGNTVYAGTDQGLSISTDGGNTFTNRTTANSGLVSDNNMNVYAVYAAGNTVYAGTNGGLSISTDGGNSFTTRIHENSGLTGYGVYGVYAVGNTVYAGTGKALYVSTDGGNTFVTKSPANGLGGYYINGVYALGNTVYAATDNGVSISTDGGNTFTNHYTANGLAHESVRNVYAVGNVVYASTDYGLSISTDQGNTFTNRTAGDNGLGSGIVYGVSVVGDKLYVATSYGVSFCSGPLPVSLTYFIGQYTPTGNQLTWQTSNETNNDYFLLERATDALHFEPIAQLRSSATNGQSQQPLSYSFTDATPSASLTYYRLQQVDYSGVHTASSILAVRSDVPLSTLYPNPASNAGEVVLRPALSYASYQLLDAGGKVVQKMSGPGKLSRLVVDHLPTGEYILVVERSDGLRHSYRLVR